jgi:hypothetical protein
MSYFISIYTGITDLEPIIKGYVTRAFIYYLLNFSLDNLSSILVLLYMNAFRYVEVVSWVPIRKFIPCMVKTFALYMIAVVSPLVIMALVNVVTVRSWWDFHNGSSYAYARQRTLNSYFLNLATLGGTLTHRYFDGF